MNLIIVGAGPAGLMAAVTAAVAGCKVTIYEQLPHPGAKLLASGGTKCNLTNIHSADEMFEFFGRQGRFTLPALKALSPEMLRSFFADRGVPTICEDGFHFFPKSGRARDVLGVLLDECERYSVKIVTSTTVRELSVTNNDITGVVSPAGFETADAVIIATGGKGYPKLGGRGLGYVLADQVGHHIVEPVPGMTGIRAKEEWPGRCAGISFENSEALIDLPRHRKQSRKGELLFTHHGVSGPAVIDYAADISMLLKKHETIPVKLRLFPDKDRGFWLREFKRWQEKSGKRSVVRLLSGYLPRKMSEIFCDICGVADHITAAEFSALAREQLAGMLDGVTLSVNGTEGWDKAMVTRGGITLKEVDPKTLESKLVGGLYFAGEVLDIDGPCGGYNLQWAFSSGHLAGKAVKEFLKT